MSYDTILAKSPSIIFRPGGVSGGIVANTWAEVQAFVALRQGACIVYVDDSLAAAHVPAASGITDGFGRLEIRPHFSTQYPTLTVDDGATLKSLYRISAPIFLELDCRSATPSLDWNYAFGPPSFFIEGGALIGNAATATQPAAVVPVGKSLVWSFLNHSGSYMGAAAIALIDLSGAGSTLAVYAFTATFSTGLLVTGGVGTSASYNYDSTTLNMTNGLPAMTAAVNTFRQTDSHAVMMSFNASANNVLAGVLPAVGTLAVTIEGFGGAGGGGGGAAGATGNGGGGSGACAWQSATFDFNLTHRLDVVIGTAGGAGGAGVAPGGNGGNGTDGGPSSALDFTTGFTLASLQGSSAGTGGLAAGGGGNGGGTYGGASISPTTAAGFSAASFGGPGGANGGAHPGLPGQKGLVSLPGAATVAFAGGVGGTSVGAQGGGGGGGGMGPFANGAAGGNATANVGGAGGASTANSGNGAGGGAGGAGAADNGGAGGAGALGFVRLRFVVS